MLVSESVMKWAMRLYPPLLFQRINTLRFYDDFHSAEVKINKSFLNKNHNQSIFGGTIFSAADPFYPVLFYQVLIRKGYNIRAWSRSSAIRFIKPGKTDLHFKINITTSDIANCEEYLNSTGRYRKSYPVQIFDTNQQLCVSVINEIYVRNLNFLENKADAPNNK